MGTILGPKYIPYSYMEPLGFRLWLTLNPKPIQNDLPEQSAGMLPQVLLRPKMVSHDLLSKREHVKRYAFHVQRKKHIPSPSFYLLKSLNRDHIPIFTGYKEGPGICIYIYVNVYIYIYI